MANLDNDVFENLIDIALKGERAEIGNITTMNQARACRLLASGMGKLHNIFNDFANRESGENKGNKLLAKTFRKCADFYLEEHKRHKAAYLKYLFSKVFAISGEVLKFLIK